MTGNQTDLAEGAAGKEYVADVIFATLKQWESDPRFEVTRISPLQLQVRYRKNGTGAAPRYFNVRISEPV